MFETRHRCTLPAPPADGETTSKEDLPKACDLIVLLGGDGTLIGMARRIARAGVDVPIPGVNFGSLGFLTEITLDELYPSLEAVLDGTAPIEKRMMLHARTLRDGSAFADELVLNDVVITKAALSRIIELVGLHRRRRGDAGARRRPDRRHADRIDGLQPRRRRPDRAAGGRRARCSRRSRRTC